MHFVFVVEQSRAMLEDTYDHDQDPETPKVTPWTAAHELMHELLPDWPGDTSCCAWPYFGLVTADSVATEAFPSAAACAGPEGPRVPIGYDREGAVLASLPSPAEADEELVGAAPMVAAYDAAVEHMVAEADKYVYGRIALVMHTPPNCAVGAQTPHEMFETLDENLRAHIQAALEDYDIGTHVIALGVEEGTSPVVSDGRPDGVDAVAYFDDLAAAGGYPQWQNEHDYISNSAEALEMAECLVCTSSCVVPLAPPPPDLDQVELRIDGKSYPRIENCSTEDGWLYLDVDLAELCGAACKAIRGDPKPGPPPNLGPKIEFIYGCPD
jgi:hypothetical protein